MFKGKKKIHRVKVISAWKNQVRSLDLHTQVKKQALFKAELRPTVLSSELSTVN